MNIKSILERVLSQAKKEVYLKVYKEKVNTNNRTINQLQIYTQWSKDTSILISTIINLSLNSKNKF